MCLRVGGVRDRNIDVKVLVGYISNRDGNEVVKVLIVLADEVMVGIGSDNGYADSAGRELDVCNLGGWLGEQCQKQFTE